MDKNRPEFYVPPPESYINAPGPPKQIPALPNVAFVDSVIDTLTGRPDTLIPGNEICIKGTRIKITPEDEDGLGVFFVSDGKDVEPFTTPAQFFSNAHSLLTVQVPKDLPKGKYILRIVTRYSGSNFLKHQRIIDYKNVVTCKPG